MSSSISLDEYRRLIVAGISTSSKPKRKRGSEEEDIQRAIIEWVDLSSATNPILNWVFHPPNGGGRSRAEGGALKATGVRKGVPDLILPFASAFYKGMMIEVKAKKGALTQDQKKWLKKGYEDGFVIGVVRSLDEFIKAFKIFENGAARTLAPGFSEIFE